MENMEKPIHVVMLPWLGFGHMIPFLNLSIAMAKQGVRVSFVSTPKNIQRLPKLPTDVRHLINMVELPFLSSVATSILLEGDEATVDIPVEKMEYLKMAYDLLAKPFKQFIADQSPDWIIVDVLPHWAVEIAEEYHVPLILFSVFTAAFLVLLGSPEYLDGDAQKKLRSSPESLTSTPAWVNFPSSVAFRRYEAINFFAALYQENASAISDVRRIAKIYRRCHAIVIRSCEEFEGEYLNLLAKITGKPVIPVGLLPPEQSKKRETTDEPWNMIFKWLDEQKARSVVFVGFGSECKLTKEQVYEIAYGLEASELPFIWALQKPSWATSDLDALPPGFGHRTSSKGVVHIGWAPQKDILAHPSIGGSLFHSGWGSAIEVLQYGNCLVVLPFVFDQGLNARLLVEKGLAVEVERSEDGSFSRNDIAKSLKQAIVSQEGEELRENAREAASVFGDPNLHHEHYIDQFIEFLKNGQENSDGM